MKFLFCIFNIWLVCKCSAELSKKTHQDREDTFFFNKFCPFHIASQFQILENNQDFHFSHSKTNSHFDTRSEIYPSRTLVKIEILKRLIKVHKTSEIVRENAYEIHSRTRWPHLAFDSHLALIAARLGPDEWSNARWGHLALEWMPYAYCHKMCNKKTNAWHNSKKRTLPRIPKTINRCLFPTQISQNNYTESALKLLILLKMWIKLIRFRRINRCVVGQWPHCY